MDQRLPGPGKLPALLIVFTGLCQCQQAKLPDMASEKPPCLYFARADVALTFKQKACYYRGDVLGGQTVFAALFMGGIAQLRHDPEEWGQGAKGYGERVGTRAAQSVTKSTAQFAIGALLREDPRMLPSDSQGNVGQRILHGLAYSVVVGNDRGKRQFAFSRVAASFASGFVGDAWYPHHLGTPSQSLIRTGYAFGGYVASSIFAELKPDLTRLASAIFRGHPKDPAESQKRSQERKRGGK